MWKRWSIKPLAGVTSEENKAKQQHTPTTADQLDRGPSASLVTGLKDAATNVTIRETVLDPQEQMDKVPESHPILTQVPVPQNPENDMVKQSTTPVNYTEVSPTESSGDAPPDSRVSPEIASPSTTTSTPRADCAELPLPSLRPSPDTVGYISSEIPGNVAHAPTCANTLSAPGPDLPNLETRGRRLSFRSIAFFYGRDKQVTPVPNLQAQEYFKSGTPSPPKPSRAQKEAFSSAIALRTLMIGPGFSPSPPKTSIRLRKDKSHHPSSTVSLPPPNLKKVKAQLLKPESANSIISHLRRLPLPDGPSFHVSNRASSESLVTHPDAGGAPIHAVCLACTDEDAEKIHFSRLRTGHSLSPPSLLTPDAPPTVSSSSSPNIGTASLESLIPVLRDLRIVSLLTSPDLGFGQPVGDGEDNGILSGSVPSPATLVEGFEEITTQLMMLGFATSKAVMPSHAGIYPPLDRMSVLTYWWGLELVLPEPSVQYLAKVKSISKTLLNFLSALALFNNGVREALPFVRYISNFVDFEWSAITAQDKGRGVVCAATWVMPAAMVPRPWDFPSRPEASPKSPVAPTSPAVPKASAGKGEAPTDGTHTPMQPPVEDSCPSDTLYPVAPAMPMMPQLMVTPATLPRNFPVPQQAGA